MPNEFEIIERFFNWNFIKFIRNKNIKKFFLLKSEIEKKRIIYSGNINSKKIFYSKEFIYAFCLANQQSGTVIITQCQQ